MFLFESIRRIHNIIESYHNGTIQTTDALLHLKINNLRLIKTNNIIMSLYHVTTGTKYLQVAFLIFIKINHYLSITTKEHSNKSNLN